jgi:hypothetical protein
MWSRSVRPAASPISRSPADDQTGSVSQPAVWAMCLSAPALGVRGHVNVSDAERISTAQPAGDVVPPARGGRSLIEPVHGVGAQKVRVSQR